MVASLLLALACAGDPEPSAPTDPAAPAASEPAGGGAYHVDPGGARPPIPADHPAWANLREGFVPAPHFYGEARWDDVEMRVFGHQAAAMRDLARLQASGGDLAAAATTYAALAERLDAIELGEEGISRQIREILASAARRDAALCAALAAGEAPPIPETPVAALRAHQLAGAPAEQIQRGAQAILDDPPWASLDTADFEDFAARHALRVALYRHAMDASDPLHLGGPWGYWTADEAALQVHAIREAAGAAESAGWAADRMRRPVSFTADGLGALPTGDTYIDTAGEPGPVAIGQLERLDVDDPDHRAWLTAEAERLRAALAADPASVPAALAQTVAALDAHPHGSRFYNVKAAKNAGVRALAGAGAYRPALAVLATSWPLHSQDWVCPNRDGILLGIEGRLLALAGDPGAAAKLQEAIDAGDAWLEKIADAEARGLSGPPHPPPGGQQGPPK